MANNFCVTDPSGKCSVIFTASEVSGVEGISAQVSGDPANQATKNLNVQVHSLINLSGPVPFGICSDCRLTGETTVHQSNHYLTGVTALAIAAVAGDFKEEFQATLGLNDMSLEGGGLFDIDPTTQFPNGAFWHAPHNFHREGKSVDIDQCAESTIEDNPNSRGPITRIIRGKSVHS